MSGNDDALPLEEHLRCEVGESEHRRSSDDGRDHDILQSWECFLSSLGQALVVKERVSSRPVTLAGLMPDVIVSVYNK